MERASSTNLPYEPLHGVLDHFDAILSRLDLGPFAQLSLLFMPSTVLRIAQNAVRLTTSKSGDNCFLGEQPLYPLIKKSLADT